MILDGGAGSVLKFSKAGGELDAVNLYRRRAGELSWTPAGTMLRSPFVLHIPLAAADMPETWELCARGVVGNAEIGGPSDPKVVIVS